MMIRVLLLGLLAFPGDGVSQSRSAVANTELACSGGVRETVMIEPAEGAVTVSTIIRAAPIPDKTGMPVSYDLPVYTHSIHHSDGALMLRYEARGLFNNAGALTCDERLGAAQRQLIDSLNAATRLDESDTGLLSLPVRMSQLSACLSNAEACNREPHYVVPSNALRNFGAGAFSALLDKEPWTFSVFVSDCQLDTYIYDPESRTVLNVESTGC